MTLETARGCHRTTLVMFLLEELGEPYDVAVREPGYFTSRFHALGPLLRDGDLSLLELDAVLRHIARTRGRGELLPGDARTVAEIDRWMEVLATLRAAAARLRAPEGAADAHAAATAARCVAALDRALDGRHHLLGGFTVADVPAVLIAWLASFRPDIAVPSKVLAWAGRVAARPAWARAQGRHREILAGGAA